MNCAEAVGAPASAVVASDDLEQAVGGLGALCNQAKEALAKSTGTLGAVYQVVFPTGVVPSTVDGFADVFGPGTSTMAGFARANTVRGSESTIKLLMGHGIDCDYEAALFAFPRKGSVDQTESLHPDAREGRKASENNHIRPAHSTQQWTMFSTPTV